MSVTQESIYEQLFPFTTLMKQRVWDNFDGVSLNERWATRQVTATASFQMANVENGGFEIVVSGAVSAYGQIDFNNIRQYSETASVMIGVCQRVAGASRFGFGGYSNLIANNLNGAVIENKSTGSSFYQLIHSDGAVGVTGTDTTIAPDTSEHSHKLEWLASSITATIDGVLEATASTNLPTIPYQPTFFGAKLTNTTSTQLRIKYCEAFNR